MKQPRQQVRIFVRNATVLDCALWDPRCGPRGQSWQVDVEWHGHTDEEGVIVDFSLAKKTAKELIDRMFDHRLLIAESAINKTAHNTVICCPQPQLSRDDCFLIETYREALALLPEDTMAALSLDDTQMLELAIAHEIKCVSPSNITEIRVRLKPHEKCEQATHFNYLHSLRLHNGNCQRFHGHSNIVEVFEGDLARPSAAADVATALNGKYLVAENYLCHSSSRASEQFYNFQELYKLKPETHALIEYQGTQGVVTLMVPKRRLILMPDESTIENISQWIHESFFSKIPQIQVYGYEGHQKGAIYP
jgi:6-pyruvoyl-tetrahydropterin synthase